MASCQCCNLPEKQRIQLDRAIVRGKSQAQLAREYKVSENSVNHHSKNHINYQLERAQKDRDILEGLNLQAEIDDLIRRTKEILYKAEQGEKLTTALRGIDSLRSTYQLLTDIAFRLHDARVKELELERERSGAKQKEEEEALMEKIRNLLTDSELDLYYKLLEKLELEDPEINVVEEYRDSTEMEFLRSIEREDWSKRGHVGEVTADKHRPTFEMDDEPEPDLDDDDDEPEREEPDPRPECEKKGMHRTKPPAKTRTQRVLREFD